MSGELTSPEEPGIDIPVTEPSDPVDETTTAPVDSELIDNTDSSAPVVPEPSSFLMMAVGSIFGGAIYNRRRRKQKAEHADKTAEV